MKLQDNLTSLSKQGDDLISTNKTYNLLFKLMNNNDFCHFIDKYSENSEDMKAFLMFVKMHRFMDKKFGDSISSSQKIAMISKLINNSHTRKRICSDMSHWLGNSIENPKKSLTDGKNRNDS